MTKINEILKKIKCPTHVVRNVTTRANLRIENK